ncbi:MAG: acyl-CoA dehydrogenase family protein [Firmicutes bacterium]|nr:acyl-CoA dehydrogenase family protein [Bacillota bacterium]
MIAFELTAAQEELRNRVRSVGREVIAPLARELDAAPEPDPHRMPEVLAAHGLNCLLVPEECGGPGYDNVTAALVLEEIAAACAGAASIVAATMHAMAPLMIAGTDGQRRRYLPALARGGVAGFALSEPRAGSDAGAVATAAHPAGEGYLLEGRKSFVFNAGVAVFYTVFATSDPRKGKAGINAYLVPGDAPGLRVTEVHDKMGLRTSTTGELLLDRVYVPGDGLIGHPGTGYLLLAQTLDWGRAFFGAIGVGLARAAFEAALSHARRREQFGRPIVKHQGVSFLLAEMATRVDAARLLVWRACRLMDREEDFTAASSMAKLFASEAARYVCGHAVLILGREGYVRRNPVEKYYRDAKALEIVEGTSQIQRMIIASQL